VTKRTLTIEITDASEDADVLNFKLRAPDFSPVELLACVYLLLEEFRDLGNSGSKSAIIGAAADLLKQAVEEEAGVFMAPEPGKN